MGNVGLKMANGRIFYQKNVCKICEDECDF
jgi:hypothetical protein